LLPEEAVVVDEGNTAGIFVADATAGTPPHDWLTLTGGAIGMGLPLATGAAVAAPGRRVLCLEADGSAMYTVQALWTQAREGLDVTTVVLANRAYAILAMELSRVGTGEVGPQARAMLDLAHPPIDFVSLAQGLGVPASRATTAGELVAALEWSLSEPGPSLVEAVLADR
jgi:acetolactate synthase-1/2/3 large subunit